MFHSNEHYFYEWEIIREELMGLSRTKDMKKVELMRKGIELIVSILDELVEAAPLNYKERISFIESNLERHVAIVQLDELFKETKKKIARLRAQHRN
ncbi:YpoC family protein [Psychrobacillus sp. NPDC096623]|uniref:YpoC family protein n=1 Tax=Psychrobacillus sp. NPDC096623 TaxID=3364492 RepID=UPI0038039EC5